jgi:hypothetical protein
MADPTKVIKGGLSAIRNASRAADQALEAKRLALEAANPQIKASEAYGQHEGAYMKPIFYDRMKVDLSEGKKGGPGFSGIQLVDPNYAQAKAAAGVTDQKMATRILNRNEAGVPKGAKVIWTPSVGGLEQHKSNSTLFGKFADIFANQRKNMSADEIQKLSDYASTKVDNKGKLIFPNGIDLGSNRFRQKVTTYNQRALMADIFAGRGVGGEKGRTVPVEELLEKNLDPNVAGAGTLDLGNRLFRLDGNVIDRPDLHSDYRKILTGEDLNVNYTPVPIRDVYTDWEAQKKLELLAQGKDRDVTQMDYTKNDPTVQLTEALLTKMQKAGQKKGGVVRSEESKEDMARFQKRFAMHKAIGGKVTKMAGGGRASIFDAPKMANGGATHTPPKKTEGFVEEGPKNKSIFDKMHQAVKEMPKIPTSPLGAVLNLGYEGYKYFSGKDPVENFQRELNRKLNPKMDTGSAPVQEFEKFAEGGNVLKGNILAGASWNSINPTLANRLTEATGMPTYNAAVGATTSADTYKQLMDFIEAGGSFENGANVFLQAGGADFLKGVPRKETQENLDKILTELENQGVNVVLTGSPNASSYEQVISNNFDPASDQIYNNLVAKHSNVVLVDSMGEILQDKSLLSDSIHPNEQGWEVYNDSVLGALSQLNERNKQPENAGAVDKTEVAVESQDEPVELAQQITQTYKPEERYTQEAVSQDLATIFDQQAADPIKQDFQEAITQEPVQTQQVVDLQPPVVQEAAVPTGPDYSRAYDALGGADVVNNLRNQFLGMGIEENTIADIFSNYYSNESQPSGAGRFDESYATEQYKRGGAVGRESPADMARFKKRFAMHKAIGGAVKKPQKFDGGGIASPEESSASDGKETYAGLLTEFLAKAAKDQGKEELSSLSKPRAATDLLNRGVLANNPVSAIIDMVNMGLIPLDVLGSALTGRNIKVSSDKPFLGSEHLKDLMNEYNITSGEERPMMETALSFASPVGMIKGAQKTADLAKKAPEALNTVRGGLETASADVQRPFRSATLTMEGVAPDLGQKGGDKFKDLVTKRMITGEGAPVSMERMGGRKTEQTMGQGLYENFAKQLETNPMVGITIPRAGDLSTNKRLIADIGTAGRELGQEMVAAHKFTPLLFKNPKDATAMMIGGSEPLTKDQILRLSKSLPGMIVSHSPKNNSMFIAPFEGDALDYKKAAQAASEILGKGAKVQFGKADSTKDIMFRGDYDKMEARPPSAESTEMRNRLKKAEERIVRGPSVSQSQRQSPPSTLTSTVR